MKSENLILETSANEIHESVNMDELITDFLFQHKIVQMNIIHDIEDNTYGFCIE